MQWGRCIIGKPSAPKPADPKVTAAAQTGQNINTAIANQYMSMTNQVGPDGSLSYKQTGSQTITDPNTGQKYKVPTFTAKTELAPQLQKANWNNQGAQLELARTGKKVAGQLNEHFSDQFDLDGIQSGGSADAVRSGDLVTSYGNHWKDRQRVENALMKRMNPSLQQDREALEARLASQGIAIGSKAYQDAMSDYSRQSNDARLGAIINAGQEQSRLAGLARDSASFTNAALTQQQSNDMSMQQYRDSLRGRDIQERLTVRNQPLNEISALLSGSQVSMPQFVNTPNATVANTDYAGLVANRDAQNMNAYSQQMGQWNNIVGGGMGLGSAAIIASDRRVKENIKKVGKTDDGQPIYSYRYKTGGPIQLGLMAQDVEKKKPEAVKTVGGIKMVDYGKALK